ncbi:MAG: carboxypeptidase-like regulatory domain-containing protein [Candidatus Binataceae bacterium]
MATGLIANAANTATSDIRKNVTGTVRDALGRPMEGVSLLLQTEDGHIVSQAATDKAGRFEFRNIGPGTYAVVANKTDFKTAATLVTVTSAGAKPLDLALEAQTARSLQLTLQELNQARNDPSPETAGNVYRFSQQAIDDLPAGTNSEFHFGHLFLAVASS